MKQFRKEYTYMSLNESDILPNPFEQFGIWFREAGKAGIAEPNAMALATAEAVGMPSVRMVLLKEVDKNGFIFYTNYNSRKGRQLSKNDQAALLFYWELVGRQVRVEGRIEKISDASSDQYFQSRPRESQASAIVSQQSYVIEGRENLELSFFKLLESDKQQLKRPDSWGGYKLHPLLFEFWQGREHRLHDRIQYRLADGIWIRERLSP